ncbi:MAG TPA: hypothetical protein VK436_05830 [Methanocella sp.]|nr:hypothetical protein [Methanocella sp.]
MKPGVRYGLLLFTGLTAVLLILTYTAYGITTYGSIRGIVGEIAAQPDQAVSLHDQYLAMNSFFNNGQGDIFTYHFGSLPISLGKSDTGNLDEGGTISLMLDVYTSNIYHVKYNTGVMGRFGGLFNAETNLVLGILMLIVLGSFIVLTVVQLFPYWEEPLPKKLMEEGLIIISFCIVALFIFLLVPPLIKSIFWNSIPGTDGVRDIIRIIESRIVSSLLVDDILVLISGLALFSAGFYLKGKMGGEKSTALVTRRSNGQNGDQRNGRPKSKYKGLGP